MFNPDAQSSIPVTVAAIIDGERDVIANLANCAAVLFHTLPDVNWAGFYLVRDDELVLGPFHGKPACIRIGFGKGVCGAAWERSQTLRVDDVHTFPGHIACDATSLSELVVPIVVDQTIVAVLDIDSPQRARFTDDDVAIAEHVARLLAEGCDW
jgi:L-methionine (R)-S-oxide reductase